MSTKSKLIIGIVLLAVGAGLVPTGLVANDYLRDEVYDGVPEAMIKIKRDAVSALEPQIPVLATPDVLVGVFDEASVGVEPLLTLKATPDTLLGLKARVEAEIPDLINFSTTAQLIAFSIDWLNTTYGFDVGTNIFFNDTTFADPFTFLPGVSNMTGIPQNYTLTARTNLLLNGMYDAYIPPYTFPGLIADTSMGTGVGAVYNLFWYIVMGGDGYTNAVVPAAYNITLAQVADMANYLWAVMTYYVPGSFFFNFDITVAEGVATGFYRQWANGTFIPDGVDLSVFLDSVGTELKGYEVGVPEPTNISVSTCIDLWNSSHPLSFTNEDGIMAWVGAGLGNTTLKTLLSITFGLTPTQLTMIITWLNDFMTNLTPVLIFEDKGVTVGELSVLAFYEQWTNGTIFGEVVLPDGFLGELDASFAGAPYFEVGLPNATGLSLTEAMDLWDSLEVMSFTDPDGFENVWLPAIAGDTGNRTALIAEFGISSDELTALLTWLADLIDLAGDPATGRVAEIIEFNEGVSITYIATLAVYEQWSEGTINGEIRLPEGFLSERDPPIYGPPYFEVSLTVYSLGLNDSQVQALWDESSEYSLLTVSGVNKWYKAEIGNTIYETLRVQNGNLAWWQMYGILEWLPQFRDNIVNKLAKDDRNLPMKPYELGETLALSLGIGGGALAALGIVFLILSRRT